MNRALYARRRVRNSVFLTLSVAAAIFGIAWLTLILYALITRGMHALSYHIFTEMTPAQGSTRTSAAARAPTIATTVTRG